MKEIAKDHPPIKDSTSWFVPTQFRMSRTASSNKIDGKGKVLSMTFCDIIPSPSDITPGINCGRHKEVEGEYNTIYIKLGQGIGKQI